MQFATFAALFTHRQRALGLSDKVLGLACGRSRVCLHNWRKGLAVPTASVRPLLAAALRLPLALIDAACAGQPVELAEVEPAATPAA